MSDLEIVPAARGDARDLADIYTDAFRLDDEKIYPIHWGSCPRSDYMAFMTAEFERWTSTPHVRCFKAVSGGGTLGFALWFVMSDPERALADEKPKNAIPAGVTEHLHFFFSSMQSHYEKMYMPRIYLHILAVRREAQRRGIGKALLAWGHRQSQELELPLNLEASKFGAPLYLAQGFRICQDDLKTGPGPKVMVKLPAGVPVQVEPATISDLAPLTKLYRRAFDPTSLHQAIFGEVSHDVFDREYGAPAIRSAIEDAQNQSSRSKRKYVLKATCAGVVLGLAIWEHHTSVAQAAPSDLPVPSPQTQKSGTKTFPAGTNVDLATALFRRADIPPDEGDYWHLAILAVEPGFQKLGAGRLLMRWGLDQADEAGEPVRLVSTGGESAHLKGTLSRSYSDERATDVLPYYRSYGFEAEGPAREAQGFLVRVVSSY